MAWVKRFLGPSKSNPDVAYIVGVSDDDTWGCSCPWWRNNFPRPECKHIKDVKLGVKRGTHRPITLAELAFLKEQSKSEDKGQISGRAARLAARYKPTTKYAQEKERDARTLDNMAKKWATKEAPAPDRGKFEQLVGQLGGGLAARPRRIIDLD